MAYQRKTYDEYQIHGNYGYGHGFEEVTAETSILEARDRLREYRENEPGVPFKVVTKRVPIVEIPADFPVKPLKPSDKAADKATCGTCGRSWDDTIPTSWTPAPSGRCPFEYYH